MGDTKYLEVQPEIYPHLGRFVFQPKSLFCGALPYCFNLFRMFMLSIRDSYVRVGLRMILSTYKLAYRWYLVRTSGGGYINKPTTIQIHCRAWV